MTRKKIFLGIYSSVYFRVLPWQKSFYQIKAVPRDCSSPGQPQPPPAEPQAPQVPEPPDMENALLNTKLAPVGRST